MAANLNDLTYYANRSQGGIGAEEINSDRARAALASAQQYDPGASWRQVTGSDGQNLGYTLDFDASRLPGVSGQGQLGATSGHGSGADFQIPFSTVQDHMHLANPNAVGDSPVYGKVTDNRNIIQDSDWITKYGPLIISALGMGMPMLFGAAGLGMGAAGAAQSAIGAANGGLAASAGGVSGLAGSPAAWIVNAAKGIPNMGNQLTSGHFNPLSLIPLATGAAGLPSWVGAGATTIGNLARGAKPSVNPLSAGALALQLFGGSGQG